MNVPLQLRRLWNENDGLLSFEWTLLVTLVAIGVVCGLSVARDAVIDELGDVAEALVALDDSYVLDRPLALSVDPDGAGPQASAEVGTAAGSAYVDGTAFRDCNRSTAPTGQSTQADNDS
ncbi:MAG: hypothetical protein SFU86_00680 [Pirellulaceae bacterium]|nr:hypothetical protein [Pirellulaceae bacterium]